MLIGIDFDNTIAGYDRVFVSVARGEGFLENGEARTKIEVRDALRRREHGEKDWMRLQGRTYGAHMGEAELMEGVSDFFARCGKSGTDVCIVSHKTEYGHFDPEGVNLRQAALTWMDDKGFFDEGGFAIARDAVFFESTRQEKIDRISALGCTHFIDDLEEVLREPGFPTGTQRYLFAPAVDPLPSGPFRAFRSWRAIGDDILGSAA